MKRERVRVEKTGDRLMKEAEEGTKIIKWTEDSENSTRTGRNKRARQS